MKPEKISIRCSLTSDYSLFLYVGNLGAQPISRWRVVALPEGWDDYDDDDEEADENAEMNSAPLTAANLMDPENQWFKVCRCANLFHIMEFIQIANRRAGGTLLGYDEMDIQDMWATYASANNYCITPDDCYLLGHLFMN